MSDQGNIVGNYYDKYGTKNPVARLMMASFLGAASELFNKAAPRAVLEVGCGEGHLANHLMSHATSRPERFEACDLELTRLAKELDPGIVFRTASVYELPYGEGEFDLVVCCEVLEHLDEPARALRELTRVARSSVLLSTPREPLWRVLNMMRGKYLGALGNTPGHIQHFNRRQLLSLVGEHFDVREVRTPVPWTMLLADVRR